MTDFPFKSDGCSMWPDGPWRHCCVEHDQAYWKGGSRRERLIADKWLYVCVDANGHPWIALLMYIGVRIGGHPWLPFPWRWGYGWKWPRGYAEAASDEGFSS